MIILASCKLCKETKRNCEG